MDKRIPAGISQDILKPIVGRAEYKRIYSTLCKLQRNELLALEEAVTLITEVCTRKAVAEALDEEKEEKFDKLCKTIK